MTKQKYVSIQVYPGTKERFQQIEGPLGSSQNSIMEKLLDMWEHTQRPQTGNTITMYRIVSTARFYSVEEAEDFIRSHTDGESWEAEDVEIKVK